VNPEPREVIMGPMELWMAAVGTAFPAPDAAPGAGWTKIGKSGNANYTEDGVTIEASQTLAFFRGLGSTLPVKAVRSEEDIVVSVSIADMTAEQLSLAFNGNVVTSVSAGVGTPGTKSIQLERGSAVTQFALLARGASPYADTGYGQFELPVCVNDTTGELNYNKSGDATAPEYAFRVMADLTLPAGERAGRFMAMSAAALS
jgi:hypothetical protein